MRSSYPLSRRGVAALFTLFFLAVIATLAVMVYTVTFTQMTTAKNLRDGDVARVCADNGMLWISWVFQSPNMPKPLDAQITSATAKSLWTTGSPAGSKSISQVIVDAANGSAVMAGDTTSAPTAGQNPLATRKIACDGGGFQIQVQQDATDGELLHVTSTGYCGNAVRTVKMDFYICKGFNYAIWSSLGLALGKNTVIEGDIAIPSKFQAGAQIIWGLSDFIYSKDVIAADLTLKSLSTDINTFAGLISKYNGLYSNQITLSGNRIPYSMLSAAEQAQFPVHRDPNYLDEYDLFLKNFGVHTSDTQHQVAASSGILTKDPGIVAAIKNRLGPYTSADTPRQGWTTQYVNGVATLYNNYNDAPTCMYQNATVDSSTGLYTYYAADDLQKKNPLFPTIGDYDSYAKINGQIQLGCPLAGSDYTLSAPVVNGDNKPLIENARITSVTPASFSDAVARLVSAQQTAQTQAGGPSATAGTISSGTFQNGQVQNRTISASDLLFGNYTMKVTNAGNTSLTVNQSYTLAQIAAANAGLAANKQATTADTLIYTSGKVTGDSTAPTTPVKSSSLPASSSYTLATPTSMTHNYRTEYSLYTATFVNGGTNNMSELRPVFRNITFTNVTIPKGLNAVFENCTFKGITVAQHDVSSTTAANSSNLRFQDCTVNGPLVGTTDTTNTPVPSSSGATAFSNMWEFNGNVTFDNQWYEKDANGNNVLDSAGNPVTTTTIMAPQTYVNIGTTVDPTQSKVVLKGTCVATMFDILAAAMVDGSLINCTTNSSACWNSTLGYFGPVGVGQGQGPDQYNNPAGGLGYIILRRNPKRPLPYGVSIPLQILPSWETYLDGGQ